MSRRRSIAERVAAAAFALLTWASVATAIAFGVLAAFVFWIALTA